MHLFDRGSLALHAAPAPFAATLPASPDLSPLARAMLAEGLDTVCTLDHAPLKIEDPSLRRFLALLDGSRSSDSLREAALVSGFDDPDQWRLATGIALSKALILPP